MARTREPKLTLGYFIDDGCIGFDCWCESMKCAPARARLVMLEDMFKCEGVTRHTRLDEIEAKMRCRDCGVKGEAELRPAPQWSRKGPMIQ